MSFIRVRKIKGHRYFYFCRRQRDRVSDGGNGRVKAIDICLGRSLSPDSLAYYFHIGEIDARAFCQAVLHWGMENVDACLSESPWNVLVIATLKVVQDEVVIEFRPSTLALDPMFGERIDLRRKEAQVWTGRIRSLVQKSWDKQKHLKRLIDHGARTLWLYDECCKDLQDYRQELALYLKNPDRRWNETRYEYTEEEDRKTEVVYEIYYSDDYGYQTDELISESESLAAELMTEYQDWLALIVDYAPKKLREEFRVKVIREVELTSRNAKKIREWAK
ncbi:MAG: hypothetical protein KME15_20510 [Drouetiella hepatica Uher 2000/2452]|jgi:hypothetical protein|uniref:Uncharacterized protein n=1 Tax=Drouetiella hepatica Uher 2000/2452 TaxID=904376 RepID=A0A951QFT2_9CYAN|nr:hypothetical protein [Drouetiella hepatica Uher 2000/2452]